LGFDLTRYQHEFAVADLEALRVQYERDFRNEKPTAARERREISKPSRYVGPRTFKRVRAMTALEGKGHDVDAMDIEDLRELLEAELSSPLNTEQARRARTAWRKQRQPKQSI